MLLLHGNSSCKEIFANQYDAAELAGHRLIAFDLPGHGASEDARDPQTAYTMPGYAHLIAHTMAQLGHKSYAMLGWSLGGHIGLEMVGLSAPITGLLISGTPPVGMDPQTASAGFLPFEHLQLSGQAQLSENQIRIFTRETTGPTAPYSQHLEDAVRRCDGRSRHIMVESSRAGLRSDQRQIAIEMQIPLAVINGALDPYINSAFIAGLPIRSLWQGQIHLIETAGHAPFWDTPGEFNPLFGRFLADLRA